MNLSPAALRAMAALVAAGACSVGVLVERARTRRTEAALRDALVAYTSYTGRLERELAEAERIIRDLTDARLADAEQAHHADDGIQVWAMSPEFIERLRSNRRAN